MDKTTYDDFIDDLKEDYEGIREDHYENLRDKKYVSLSEARQKKFHIDWESEPLPGGLKDFVCLLVIYLLSKILREKFYVLSD